MRESQTEVDEYRLPYWAISSPDHTTLCYLQRLTSSLPMRHTEAVFSSKPLGTLRPQLSICRLDFVRTDSRFTITPSDWDLHVGICRYNFLTPTHFWSTTLQQMLMLTGASCLENRWLTALLWVNMQQQETNTGLQYLTPYTMNLRCDFTFRATLCTSLTGIFRGISQRKSAKCPNLWLTASPD